MAQLIHSQISTDGRFRILAIEGFGRRKAQIIEIEVIDTGERVHGSRRWLRKLAKELQTLTTASSECNFDSGGWLASRVKRA